MTHPHTMKAPQGHGHPGGEKKYLPRLIAWEVTRSCVLNCVHCRAAARYGPYPGELSTEDAYKFLDDVKSFSDPIIILTGGEPMMRADIYDIAKHGTKLGLRMVMAPCGLLVTEELAQKMKDSGIMRVSLSIDGLTAEQHNNFRRVEGAFESVMKAIENFKKVGMEFQVNTTITKHNVKDLPKLLEMVIGLGAVAYHPFLLVPTGRGKELAEQELDPDDYERTLNWIYDAQQSSPLFFKPTDVPHYWRVMRQRAKVDGKKLEVHRHSHGGMNTLSRGCLAGVGFCFISHVGEVQPCGYFDKLAGNLRAQTFGEIWRASPLFAHLRDLDALKGKCGACEYKRVCGGCRARAYECTGDYMAAEPYCAYIPKGWVAQPA